MSGKTLDEKAAQVSNLLTACFRHTLKRCSEHGPKLEELYEMCPRLKKLDSALANGCPTGGADGREWTEALSLIHI